jgi:hypothetical protein
MQGIKPGENKYFHTKKKIHATRHCKQIIDMLTGTFRYGHNIVVPHELPRQSGDSAGIRRARLEKFFL